MPNFSSRVTLLLAALALGLALGACGKRGSAVYPPDSPTGGDGDRFPFVYPDPATDPAPVK